MARLIEKEAFFALLKKEKLEGELAPAGRPYDELMANPRLVATMRAATLQGLARQPGEASSLILVAIDQGRVTDVDIRGRWPEQAQMKSMHAGMDVAAFADLVEKLVAEGYITRIHEQHGSSVAYSLRSITWEEFRAHDDWMIAFVSSHDSDVPNYFEVHFNDGVLSRFTAFSVDSF